MAGFSPGGLLIVSLFNVDMLFSDKPKNNFLFHFILFLLHFRSAVTFDLSDLLTSDRFVESL